MTPSTLDYIRAHPTDTPAAIRAALAAMPPVTVSAIPLRGEQGLHSYLLRTAHPQTKMSLKQRMQGIIADSGNPAWVRGGLQDIIDQINDAGQTHYNAVRDGDAAKRSIELMQWLAADGKMLPGEVAGILALGGGLAYDVTAQVQHAREAARDAAQAAWRAWLDARQAEADTAMNQIASTFSNGGDTYPMPE